MRALPALILGLAAAAASTAVAAPSATRCDPRPVVDEFVAALNAGDVARVESLFAQQDAGWNWYSVADRAGQRLGQAARRRGSLAAYIESRVQQHELLRLLSFRHNGDGNFQFLVQRRADDLRGGEPVRRLGKGWVVCESGKIGVWLVGGAPAPAWWGQCPRNARLLTTADLPAARRAVLRFVRDVWSELAPSLDVRGARVSEATLAAGVPKGYAARISCGRSVQARTAVVTLLFPRVARAAPLSSAAFYASRTGRGWDVWRLVP